MFARTTLSAAKFFLFGRFHTLVSDLTSSIWVYTQSAIGQFSWVTSPLRAALDEAPANLRIRILLHATRNNELDSVDSFDEKDPRSPDSEKKHSWMHTEGITTKTGRPDLRAIVTEEIQATSGNICISGGSLSLNKGLI